MDERRVLRFRRRAPDGSTTPLLSPGQAEQISEAMLEEQRKAQPRPRSPLLWHWDYGVKNLALVQPPSRRHAIVRKALRNVNNGWRKAVLTFVAIAVAVGIVESTVLAGWHVKWPLGIVVGVIVGLPGFVIHTRLMRREIEALVARELEGDGAGL